MVHVCVDETGHQAVLLEVLHYGMQMVLAHVEEVLEGMQTDRLVRIEETSFGSYPSPSASLTMLSQPG